MLRNVLVITDGGLVLFSKVNNPSFPYHSYLVVDCAKIQEFVNALAQPRLVGSLLTAILEVSSYHLYRFICIATVIIDLCLWVVSQFSTNNVGKSCSFRLSSAVQLFFAALILRIVCFQALQYAI